jgi:type IV pilus assembly protein PilE
MSRYAQTFGAGGPPGDPFGMSLVELVVVVGIAGILLSIAIPSYQQYEQRSQRVDAIRMLLAAAACQEKVRAETGYYDTHACIDGMDGKYEFRITPPGNAKSLLFTVAATPRRTSSWDKCGTLSLDQAGTRGITGKLQDLAACWGGR